MQIERQIWTHRKVSPVIFVFGEINFFRYPDGCYNEEKKIVWNIIAMEHDLF